MDPHQAPSVPEVTSVSGQPPSEVIRRSLFTSAMNSKWDDVVSTYQKEPAAHRVKITKSGDTAIHVAVADGREGIVKTLVSCVNESDLEIKNDLGNTPLHQAAILGNVNMCKYIAEKNPKVIGITNEESETPFFLAVLHGKKGAFLCLNSLCENGEGVKYCRRKGDGDTILHAAITGEYFDIAFEIIRHYKELINAVNEQGISPLHLLANKPTAFRSGSHISGFHKLIYHCIFVDELKRHSNEHILSEKDLQYHSDEIYPENYHTCVGLICFLGKIFKTLVGTRSQQQNDAENPNEKQSASKQVHKNNPQANAGSPKEKQAATKQDGSSESVDKQKAGEKQSDTEGAKRSSILKTQGHQFFPENYRTCFDGLKLISKTVMIILGLGSTEIKRIREKKEKHIWSVQILKELLETAAWYEYEDTGRKPFHLLPENDGETTPYDFVDGGEVGFSKEYLFDDDDDHRQASSVNDSTGAKQKEDVDGRLGTNGNGEPKKSLEMEKKETAIRLIAAKNALVTEISKVLLENKLVDGSLGANEITLMFLSGETKNALEWEKKETPILIAAKNGIMEIVQLILQLFPVAIHDMNSDKKNIVLLAVEHRQPHMYEYLLKHKMKEALFRKTDKDGNSALHLAAMLTDHQPWRIPGAALQMQWELKWFRFVKDSMALHFFVRYNKKGEIPRQIFTETHKDLVKDGGKWLTDTAQSCSVVAALIATVAFATSATVPGGVNQDSGTPILENQSGFSVFAIASLVALCFSVTSLVMFLSILTSRYQEKDFAKSLPRKLLVGMSSLFVSIASMLLSFCAGHFFVLRQKLRFVALPVYAITCLPVTFFAILQFPLYFDLVKATFTKVPRRSYK